MIQHEKTTKEHIDFILAEPDYFTARGIEVVTKEKLYSEFEKGGETFTVLVDGEPKVVWGVLGSWIEETKTLWMISHKSFNAHRVTLLRECRKKISSGLFDGFSLIGYTENDNLAAQRWLEWMGFRKVGQLELSRIFFCYRRG